MAVAFPTTPILDTFIRADEDPLSQGGAWVSQASGGLKIVSNLATPTAANGASYRGYFGDAELYVQLVVGTTGAKYLRTRLADSGGVVPIRQAHETCYQVQVNAYTSYNISRLADGFQFTLLSASFSTAISPGDWLGMRSYSSTHEFWIRRGTDGWHLEASTTDDVLTTPGAIGLSAFSTTTTFGPFGGGITQLAADATPAYAFGRGSA